MHHKLSSELLKLNTCSSSEEKVALMNDMLNQLIAHFRGKADRSKKRFALYKYGSICFAALTTIIASLQIIYVTSFPQWILPVSSAISTVSVAFLGASGAQKIWINSRSTQRHFQTEYFLFNQQAGRYHNVSIDEAIKMFSERLVELWDQGHNRWERNVGDD